MKIIWTGDFETNIYENNSNVYAYSLISNNNQEYYGISVGEFIDDCIDILRKKKIKNGKRGEKYNQKVDIFFNNGKKFDFHFIVKALPKLGWKQQIHTSKKIVDFLRKSKIREKLENEEKSYDKTFDIFCDSFKNIYSIRLYISRKEFINFRCSYAIFNLSIKDMSKILNEKDIEKGKIDYKIIRNYKNKQELFDDKEVYNYLKMDNLILSKFLTETDKKFSYQHWEITTAKTAYNQWKLSLLPRFIKDFNIKKHVVNEKTGYTKYSFIGEKKKYTNKNIVDKCLQDILPVGWLNNTNIRNWYTGGMVLQNQKHFGKVIKNSNKIDINSSYPNVMNSERLFPIGKGFKGDGGSNYPLKLYKIYLYNDIETKYMPFVPIKETFTGQVHQYYKKIKTGNTVYLTSVNFNHFLEQYNIKKDDCKITIKWSFKARKGSYFFKEYISKWYKIKEKSDKKDILYHIAKLLQNSLYGKYGSKVERESKDFNPVWNGKTNWEITETVQKYSFYLPFALFITAYARESIVKIKTPYEKFIYTDTDCLAYINDFVPNIEIHPKKLGAWKLEQKNINFIGFGKKRYFFWNNKIRNLTMSSFHLDNWQKENKNKPIKNILEKLLVKGFTNRQKMKKETECGFIIYEAEKVLQPIWYKHYTKHKERWFSTKQQYLEYFEKQL